MQALELNFTQRGSKKTAKQQTIKQQRLSGDLPAVLYGKGEENITLSVKEVEFQKIIGKGKIFSRVIELKENFESQIEETANKPKDKSKKSDSVAKANGLKALVITKDLQFHPVTDKVIHIDFLRVKEDEEILVQIPVRFVGYDASPGLKRGGTLNIVRREVGFYCLPTFIPEDIEVDISKSRIGDSIHISHVKLPEGIRAEIADRDFTIATITGKGKIKDDVSEDSAESEDADEG